MAGGEVAGLRSKATYCNRFRAENGASASQPGQTAPCAMTGLAAPIRPESTGSMDLRLLLQVFIYKRF